MGCGSSREGGNDDSSVKDASSNDRSQEKSNGAGPDTHFTISDKKNDATTILNTPSGHFIVRDPTNQTMNFSERSYQ